jgi:hypothetical protein
MKSGGNVTGDGVDADTIGAALRSGSATFYPKAPPYGFRVDPSSDWVLHKFLDEYADRHGLELTTDYEPNDEDMPPDVAEFLEELEADPIPDGALC